MVALVLDDQGIGLVHVRESQGAVALPEGSSRIDREKRIIKGVKVVGLVSNNSPRVIGIDSDEENYSYSLDALREAIPLYEGVSVNVDHLESEYNERGQRLPSQKDRKLKDRFGKLVNVHVTEKGMFADLEYLESHPMSAMVLEAAERMPDAFALSHYAFSRPEILPDGKVQITKILEVDSVDLIGEKPGTTNGLFESFSKGSLNSMEGQQNNNGNNTTTTEMEAPGGQPAGQTVAQTLREKLLAVLNNPEMDDTALTKAIGALLGMKTTSEADENNEHQNGSATSENDDDPLNVPVAKEADEEDKNKQAVAHESAGMLNHPGTLTVEQRLANLEAVNKLNERKQQAMRLLESHSVVVTESRMSILAGVTSKDQTVDLLNGWKRLDALDPSVVTQTTLPRSIPQRPGNLTSVAQESLAGAGAQKPETLKETAARMLNG